MLQFFLPQSSLKETPTQLVSLRNGLWKRFLHKWGFINATLLLSASVSAQFNIVPQPQLSQENGDLTVTLFGTFTPKPATVLYDKTDIAYEHGVANTALSAIPPDRGLTKAEFMYSLNAAWGNASDDLFYIKKESTDQRYPKAGSYYFVDGNEAHLQSPRAQTKDKIFSTNEPKHLYVSWWYKQQNDTRDYFTFMLGNVTENFNPVEGDEFVVDVGPHWSGITQVNGRVINYDPSANILTANFYAQNNANRIKLKTLSLNKNGATALLNSNIGGQGSNKYIRVWESNGGEGAMRMSWTNTEIYLAELRGHNRSNVIARQWNHMEVFIDQINQTLKTKVNGQLDFQGTYTSAADKAGNAPSIGLIGFDSNQEMFQKVWMDDIYMDNSFQRVVLANAADYSAVTHEEVQYVGAWSGTQLKFTPNFGSLNRQTPAYIYVFDQNGTPNPQGIILGNPEVFEP